jgi:hypothetical protein
VILDPEIHQALQSDFSLSAEFLIEKVLVKVFKVVLSQPREF